MNDYSDMSDLEDIANIDLVMQLINEDEQMQGESSRRSRKAINRYRDIAEARLMTDYFGPSQNIQTTILDWAAFVKSFTVARDERNAAFKRRQESARKDVERAFGVLQGRWHIIAQPARSWTVNKLRRIIFKVPDQNSGKLELQYLHDYAGVCASVGLTANPVVNFSGVVGTNIGAFGTDVSFDTKTGNFTKYNAGLTYSNVDLIAALT
nr:mitochondrial outer membrane protein porin of 34 kDa-like [Tanacetum cinerariifolium]